MPVAVPSAAADPYAAIAAIYEAEHAPYEGDIAYFARHGGRGPLLVLGCGTGRVGRVLGPTRRVVGLDLSEAMLAVARAKAPDAHYVHGDMRAFDLGAGSFEEIIAPNAAFSFLRTRSDQDRCLRACHRALRPGGALTLDLPMPVFALLGTPHTPEKPAWEGLLGDRPARRTREVRRHPVAQRLDIVDRYYVDDALLAAVPLTLRLVFPAEAEWMLEAAGFLVEALHGDHGGAPLRETSPRLLVRAVRA